jgi:hypothetical protein
MPLLSASMVFEYEQAIPLYFTREKGELIGADCTLSGAANLNIKT